MTNAICAKTYCGHYRSRHDGVDGDCTAPGCPCSSFRSEKPTSIINDLSRDLTDKGKIIEAGWLAFKFVVLPAEVSQLQEQEMRKAFFAGAQHLFGSIMGILEPDAEPTEKDLMRMSLINQELTDFIEQFKAENTSAGGRS